MASLAFRFHNMLRIFGRQTKGQAYGSKPLLNSEGREMTQRPKISETAADYFCYQPTSSALPQSCQGPLPDWYPSANVL